MLTAVVLGIGVAQLIQLPTARSATSPPFLTISFGRAQWVQTDSACHPFPGAVPLDQVAVAMAKRGLAGVGNVIVKRTSETGFTCIGKHYLSPGWPQLAWLRDSYGWTFVSASSSYLDMTTLSRQQQYDESCGSLAAFESHGHARAWGFFAYPNNRFTVDIQDQVVSTCFAYGRRYGGINRRSTMADPWFAQADSVNGGSCNLSGQPCYAVNGAVRRYRSPVDLAGRVAGIQPDQWLNVQFYRFVTGAHGIPSGTSSPRWDCTASDWRLHWTSRTELYCYNDFLKVLDAVPAGADVTDPATVAEAWGRVPPFS